MLFFLQVDILSEYPLVAALCAGYISSGKRIGLFLSALNVSFRDVKYVVPYFTQMGIFVTPVTTRFAMFLIGIAYLPH